MIELKLDDFQISSIHVMIYHRLVDKEMLKLK